MTCSIVCDAKQTSSTNNLNLTNVLAVVCTAMGSSNFLDNRQSNKSTENPTPSIKPSSNLTSMCKSLSENEKIRSDKIAWMRNSGLEFPIVPSFVGDRRKISNSNDVSPLYTINKETSGSVEENHTTSVENSMIDEETSGWAESCSSSIPDLEDETDRKPEPSPTTLATVESNDSPGRKKKLSRNQRRREAGKERPQPIMLAAADSVPYAIPTEPLSRKQRSKLRYVPLRGF